jgi:hypothetical protein
MSAAELAKRSVVFVAQLRSRLADTSVAGVMPLGRRSGWVRTDRSGLEAR